MSRNPSDLLFKGTTVVVTTVLMAALFGGLWFVLGASRRVLRRQSH